MRVEIARQSVELPAGSAFNSRGQWTERQSLLMRIEDCAGLVGYGEATPLEGFSREDFDQAARQLGSLDAARLAPVLSALQRGATVAEAFGAALQVASGEPLCASAHFAADCALLELAAAQRGCSVADLLASELPAPTPALERPRECVLHDLLGSGEQLVDGVTIKCKIGRDLPAELEALRRLRVRHAGLRLRLDANGALPPLELDRWLAVFGELEPEFIEEPCALEQLGSPRRLSVPLAFDETLSRAPLAGALAAWLQSGAVRAIVVKPMLLGGITQSLGWFHVARQHGQEVIVSHLFDGSVAAAMYRQLALFASPQLAMGLGSHDGLRLWQHVRLSPAVDGSAPSQLNRSSNL
jgi:o-succinylbenzoate synthase